MDKDKERVQCHDCGVREGELHVLGCDTERCPFCGYQLITCDCCYELLGLFDTEKYDDSTAYLPPDIYSNGLPDELEERWKTLLNQKGRIPYIQYPVICAKCGELYPEFFTVPDEEWERYIQPNMRGKVLCKTCYEYIKDVIDTATHERGGNDTPLSI